MITIIHKRWSEFDEILLLFIPDLICGAVGRLEDIPRRLEDPDGRQGPHLVDGVLEVSQVPGLVVAQGSLHVNILWLLEDDLLNMG